MANNVNPPGQLRIPDEFRKNQETSIFFERLLFVILQLFERTGAGNDFIEENTINITQITNESVSIEDVHSTDATEQLKDDDNVVVTSVDYLTSGTETVICNASITVTLNAEPDDRELVKIHARNGRVRILGNGKKINKQDDALIKINFTTWDLLYLVELDEWVII